MGTVELDNTKSPRTFWINSSWIFDVFEPAMVNLWPRCRPHGYMWLRACSQEPKPGRIFCSGVITVSGAIHNSYNHLELPSTCHYVQMELACWCVYTQDIDSFFEIFCLWHFSDLMICFQTQTYLLQFLVKTIFVSTSPNRLVEEVVSRALDFIPPTLQLMEWGCEPHHLH